jgi:tRNA threonylcarbamoyladenosine biosynthesis protein TsaB
MLVLALDTTTRAGSVAIVDGDRVLFERSGDPARSHAERLPGDLVEALDVSGLTWQAIDLFAVAAGPGSFTGLRIGIATIQGLAFVNRRPVAALSALLGLAHAAGAHLPEGGTVAAWMDARRTEVFSAAYKIGPPRSDGWTASADPDPRPVVEVDPPRVARPALLVAEWSTRGVQPRIVIGDGSPFYPAEGTPAVALPAPPIASILGRLAVGCARRGEIVDPGGVRPLYVRRPDAEMARDRQG